MLLFKVALSSQELIKPNKKTFITVPYLKLQNMFY